MRTAASFDRDQLPGESSSTTTRDEIPSPLPSPIEQPKPAGDLWLVPFVVVIVAWGVVILQQTVFWKVLKSRLAKRGCDRSVPCTSCRFFNSNPYMQCAVHPTRVLRTDAIDCSDYQQRE
ncbi:MAG: hypothetical protein VKK04_25385 [Synechococcales bacterium]|nr:hypothetical protein [Synechococcales bacterium]